MTFYLYTLCYYICCLLGACMRCTWLCPLKPGVTTVRCTPDSPVKYSGAPLDFPEGEEFSVKSPGAPDTVRWCTGQSGAPDQGCLRLPLALFVEPISWSFHWLIVNLWHLL